MVYIKILGENGSIFAVESLEKPVYVFSQPENGAILRCVETKAQGILDATGSKIYQLQGKPSMDRAEETAEIITAAEYMELQANLQLPEDSEDTDPEIPEGADVARIMTRMELTEKVLELDEALDMLLSGVTE